MTSEVFDLATPKSVHIVAIGGAAMSAIASILTSLGHRVTGSDLATSPVVDRLRSTGITVHVGHDASNVASDVDVVAISTAVRADNVEVVAARERGIPVLSRQDVMAAICATKRTIGVAGTHGKTTTTSMLALVLTDAGLQPSYLVGGQLTKLGSGVAWTDGDWFVVEADESDRTFLALGAEAAIVTSVEADHLDQYGDVAAIEQAFGDFLAEASGPRVVCLDDPGAAKVAAAAASAGVGDITTYGTAEGADYRIVDLETSRSSVRFALDIRGDRRVELTLPVPGAHNARNATAALALAHGLGVDPEVAASALARYGGVSRRFEFRGERNGITFVDDYAHNPGKVAAVLAAARGGGWDRVVAVFQPHLYSRTADLATEFGRSFTDADLVVVTDVYGAREDPRPGVTGALIVDAIAAEDPGREVVWCPGRSELAERVRELLSPGDLCITLGAGDVNAIHDELLAG
ncbi:MAG TPA: UDP-N-acetylmuramate--L-alanine ligase [Acidimicrobiales bacterium]|nr:UDP-N-acetylmuramate--L-alanine ligase [Acidimicrobiales bacterium]